jgi:uncharacterized membrane protein YhaH (DUF805 family)
MDPIDLLFGFSGRINRAKYWLVVSIWLVLWVIAGLLVYLADYSPIAIVVAVIVLIPSIVSATAIGIKRLHDRDKSGWWLLPFYLGPLLGLTLASLIAPGMIHSTLSFVGFLFLIWAFVELGCLRGTIAGNPYGADPVAPKPRVASH